MIDWDKRRKEYASGKFKRKIVERRPKDLLWDHIKLECGHETNIPAVSMRVIDSRPEDEWDCSKCANSE